MRRAIQGDSESFAALYRQFARAVHAILINRIRPEDADDLVQEVFVHAWQHLDDLREPAAFPGWICMIARRRAIDANRRSRASHELPASLVSPSRSDAAAQASEALETIRSLPEAYRETLAMRLVEGMSGPEIAAATGLTNDSVRVNLSRGMRMLREKLGDSR